MDWLDTQTRELLRTVDPPKPVDTAVAEFSLVLLRRGTDRLRLRRAVCRVNRCTDSQAARSLSREPPLIVNPNLSYADALLGQFELICCDAVAVFLFGEIIESGGRDYLKSLFDCVARSPEFALTEVTVERIPATDSGERFADQFLGDAGLEAVQTQQSLQVNVPYKKARIMQHWAERVGALVRYTAPPE